MRFLCEATIWAWIMLSHVTMSPAPPAPSSSPESGAAPACVTALSLSCIQERPEIINWWWGCPAQPQLRTLVCVILAELIGPLPLNSPDWSCQNYNCMSQFLASRSCVMRRVWAVMLSSSHLFVQTPFIPRVKLSERSPPANQRAHFGFLTNQKTEEMCFSLCKVSSHFPERVNKNILCFD